MTGNSITICPFTTNPMPGLSSFRVDRQLGSEANGLVRIVIAADGRQADDAFPGASLGRRIGRLDDATMLRLNRAITVFLGIAG